MRRGMGVKPELASMNMGSMNFGLFPMLNRYEDLKHDWERAHLENSRDLVFKNTFADIEKAMTLGAENATRFECECSAIGHLYNLRNLMDFRTIIMNNYQKQGPSHKKFFFHFPKVFFH